MKRGKETYDNIVVPAELSERVADAIASVDRSEAKSRARKLRRRRRALTLVKSAGALAAALFVCLTVGVNTNQVFAEEMAGLPIIGPLARVLTVRSFEATEGDVNLKVDVPEIRPETALPTKDAEYQVEEINAQIQKFVDEYIKKCKTDMEEYREAFFANGGTEEEWAGRMMDVNVSYEVKYRQGNVLSFVLTAEEAWVSAYEENAYYNIDLETGGRITLEDLLGPDYVSVANESILRQIRERVAEDSEMNLYFGYGPWAEEAGEEGFRTIGENTSFYINEKGNPVVCFAKYDIAPGYMGVQEFEIER